MSKEKKDNIKNEETLATPPLPERKRKRKKWPFIILFILVVAALIFFFRRPILNIVRDIPFVGQFVGKVEEKEPSLDELKAKVSAQEAEIVSLKSEVEALQSNNDALKAKNESLKEYETKFTDFVAQKEAWDEEVAKTNPNLFIEQFEKVYPDNAERIYSTLKGSQSLSNEQKQLAKTIAAMDETQAAKALENLIKTDPELIKVIFNGMSVDNKGLILSEMSATGASQVIKLISPDETLTQ